MSTTATATKPGAKTAGADAAAADGEKAKGGKKKLLLVVLLVLVLGGAAAWWFLLRGGGSDAKPEAAPKPELGAVLTVAPISINLAEGHYLKIGFALQQTKAASESVDGSRALDTAIELYSGKAIGELSDPVKRDALKKEFVHRVSEEYEGKVVDIYLTEYVMQ